jgi:hypothetical protein
MREARLMQRAHDRHASRMRDVAHQGQDRNCRAGVEARDRLIREQDLALLRECARDRNPLLLPARQGISTLMKVIREAHRRKGVSRPRHILLGEGAGHAPQWRRRKPAGQNVVERGHAADQVELLEHDAPVAARLRQRVSAQAGEAPSANLDLPAVRFGEPRQTTE